MIDGKRLTYLTMLAKMGEQMQGGLFDEESTRLSTTDIHGQSQTPEARYARAYRSNPENKKRINENRRKNRQMKKERTNKVGLVLESAARPIKDEQQTVERPLQQPDNGSLSDRQSGSSCKSDSSDLLINVLQHEFKTIDRNFDSLKAELKDLKESGKPTTPAPKLEEQQASVSGIAIANSAKLSETAINEKRDFLAGIFGKLTQLDGGAFITNFPAALALGYFAYLAFGFVVEQTLPLYRSLKFPNPELACYGAIVIAIGFSALSVVSKSSIAKLFTAVIIAYEVLIVWAGSQANQRDLSLEALRANPIHFSASEAYSIAKVDFEQKKARYEDNNSEVYHNGWFKINHLDPAKKSLDEASAKLEAVELKLGQRYQTNWMHLVLKALYRLSAVVLVMLLAKESMKRGVEAIRACEV